MRRGGQVTIFVILGIVIFVSVISIYIFVGKPKVIFKEFEENPQKFLQNCIDSDFSDLISLVSKQGGFVDPEFYYEYKGERIATLCYTTDFYKTCSLQVPFLKVHVENELHNGIREKFDSCFDSLKETYEMEGYQVQLDKKDFEINILPGRIIVNSNTTLSLSREKTSDYEKFEIPFYVDLYMLLGVAESMLEWESLVGDLEVTDFMSIYHDLKITKFRGSEDRKIYTIENRKSGEKFKFASRSLVFPGGLLE